MRLALPALLILVCAVAGCATSHSSGSNLAACYRDLWPEFATGVSESLRGVSGVSKTVAWASGSHGAVLRTTDGGQRWRSVSVPQASNLDFRMIHAFDANSAVVLSAGSPARLYRTEDGGASWSLVYEDTRAEIFFNAMRFDGSFGIAFGDPIGNRLQIILTGDGGRTWRTLDPRALPRVEDGVAGFAASNSSLAIVGDTICIGLGGEAASGRACVARSTDRGATWRVSAVPLAANSHSGIFSVALNKDGHGVAVGGDYAQAELRRDNVLVTDDAGRTWRRTRDATPHGYRSAVAALPAWESGTFICTGVSGSDISTDSGRSWVRIDTIGWHALSVTADGAWMWSSGSDGRIGRLDVLQPRSNVTACR